MFIRVKRSWLNTENSTTTNPTPKKEIELWILNVSSEGVVDSFREIVNEKNEKEVVAVFRTAQGEDGLQVTLDHTLSEIGKKLEDAGQLKP